MTTIPQRRHLPGISSLSSIPGFNRRGPERKRLPLVEEEASSIVAWAWYVDGVRRPAESLTQAARNAQEGEGFVWLGLKDPDNDDLQALSSQFALHPLAIEDAVNGHDRSKLETFGDDLFMVISTVAYVDNSQIA